MMKKAGRAGDREKRIKVSEDLIWGIHPVLEALQQEPQRIAEIYLLKDKKGSKHEAVIEEARQHGVKLSFFSTMKITGEGASQVRHQGMIARMNQTATLPFEKLLQHFEEQVQQGKSPRIMVCDSLQDPHNLGAVIRSAHASGMSAVLITSENSAPLSGTAAKASAGAISHIDICQVTNLATALQKLKKAGAWIFGAIKDGDAQSLYRTDLRLPACIIVGSEGKGIRPLVRKQCDILVSIPMVGQLDSLNSSVAAGIIMFEALRQNLTTTEKD